STAILFTIFRFYRPSPLRGSEERVGDCEDPRDLSIAGIGLSFQGPRGTCVPDSGAETVELLEVAVNDFFRFGLGALSLRFRLGEVAPSGTAAFASSSVPQDPGWWFDALSRSPRRPPRGLSPANAAPVSAGGAGIWPRFFCRASVFVRGDPLRT